MSFAQPFANYEILARVGSGAMGTVFKARQKHLERIVALKVLKPALARDARYVERLEREARIVAKLNHANIVTAYDLGHEGGYHYFVMEFVEGRSLRQLLGEWGAFPEQQVLDVAIQVTEALAHAFDCGIIHRDIKPGNILIDQDGRAKLTDMGLAKAETDLALTRDGATVGTPQYIAPEQAKNPQAADIRSDLYSLGATLFHMTTGQPPFRADAIGELIAKVLNERPPSVVDLVPEVSDGLSLVIRKLLAKDPRLRYQTPRDLLEDLRRVERRERPRIGRDELEADTAAEPRSPRRGRALPRRTFAALGLVLCLATGIAIGRFVLRDSTPPASPDRVTELVAEFARLPRDADRFAQLARREAAGGDLEPSLAAALRRELLASLERRQLASIAAIAGPRRGEVERYLASEEGWREPDYVRARLVPELEEDTGFRPENLPDPALGRTVRERLAVLRVELEGLRVARDAALLDEHARYLDAIAAPALLAAAQRGEPAAALARFPSEAAQFFATGGRPAWAWLSPGLVAELERVQAAARERLATRVHEVQAELARAGLAAFVGRRDAYERQRTELSARGVATSTLARLLRGVETALRAELPGPDAFAATGESPWPAIERWLGASSAELRAREGAEAMLVLEQSLDLAYAVFQDGGPRAAVEVLESLPLGDSAGSARHSAHLAAFRAGDELLTALADAVLGAQPSATVSLAGMALRVTRRADAKVDWVRLDDGAPLPFRALDLEALLALDPVPETLRARAAAEAATRLARACSLALRDAPARAVALLGAEELALFQQDCWPRLQASAAAADAAERAAQLAFEQLFVMRRNDDALAMRTALLDFARVHAATRVFARTVEYRAGLAAWAEGRAAGAVREAELRARAPAGLGITVARDGVELVSGRAGDLPSSLFTGTWAQADGVASCGVEGSAGDGGAVLGFESPFEAAAVEVAFDCELRLAAAEREARVVAIELHGAVAVLVALPGGEIAATAVPAAGFDPRQGELSRALAEPLLAAARAAPRLGPGVWHRVRVTVRREASALAVRVDWDGEGGQTLCEQRLAAGDGAVPRVKIATAQPLALRSLGLSRR